MTIVTRVLATVALLSAIASAATGESDVTTDGSDNFDGVPDVADMNVYDGVGILIMVFALALAAAGGIGGAIIMVPTMVLVMSFDIKVATPIANLGIFGGGIANAVFNMRKRHPTVDRPLIDADLVIIIIPAVIGGVIVGTVFTNLLPSYLLSLLMVVVVSAGSFRMLMRAIAMLKKETADKKEAKMRKADAENPSPLAADYLCDPGLSPSTPSAPLAATPRSASTLLRAAAIRGDSSVDPELVKLIEEERHFNWRKHSAVFCCYVFIAACSIANALVSCGSVEYWAILGAEVPCIIAFEFFAARRLLREYEHKIALNYPFADGDVRWSKKTLSLFAPACITAGVVAGTFGVGAAAITGPILIEMGVIPEVLAAMAALMVLYSSASATAKYALFNMIKWDWALLVCSLSLVVTSLSQYFILGYVRRSGRQSIILLCMLASVYIGAILMLYDGIKLTIEDSGASFSVDVCS